MQLLKAGLILSNLALLVSALANDTSSCPGYVASNVQQSGTTLTADLSLAGSACNAYATDLKDLKLLVEYQTDTRIHVKIYDADENVYQVPTSVFPRPTGDGRGSASDSQIKFTYTEKPFSFAINRSDNSDVIFDTSGSNLIFESQYLRLRTKLPANPNLYGLGESTDPFRLKSTDYVRTIWNRDAYEIPIGTNLYGAHPIYFDHRSNGKTHGVFLLSSSGMDVKINNTASDGQYLEYNTIGGVFDFYFMAGPGPLDVARQYSEVAGLPAMMPYWGLGFHQCKYGYQDVYEVADVVYNYTQAGIPLETMWTDIDYMDGRKIMTTDPLRFPLNKMRELVDHLHNANQHYVVMVDPAVAYQNYPAFNNGVSRDIFLKITNGSIYQGVVWPGVTAFPDWFAPNIQSYWNDEFDTFFSATDGIDIDALWIDMNEASNFCKFPCTDAAGYAQTNGFPPVPPPVRDSPMALPGWPADFQPGSSKMLKRAATGAMLGLPNRDLLNPAYMINNANGVLSQNTIQTDIIHSGGYADYDVHNLYGTMMSSTSRGALLSRRPTRRPMVITRSTFAGAGTKVGHWLGDNSATWHDYLISIKGMLEFASIFQVPMVGSDVCGYAQNTNEELCARWAMLGAFYPFYRNHAASDVIYHEFYRWTSVTQAAKTAIDARYRMLDYFYTAMYQQTVDGTPLVNAMFYLYPLDANTFGIEHQWFFGPSVLISPVTDQGATSVQIYLPNDIFYDFFTYKAVRGQGSSITLNDISITQIPIHVKGGSVLPLRIKSANTTTDLRKNDFTILVAPGLDSKGTGSLYLDDGDSLVQASTSNIQFSYANQALHMSGKYGYDVGSVKIAQVVFLGVSAAPGSVAVNHNRLANSDFKYDSSSQSITVTLSAPLSEDLVVDYGK